MNYSAQELEPIDAARRAEDWLPEHDEGDGLDAHGNPLDGSAMPNCAFPDCGCPEPRLCMASTPSDPTG